MSPFDNIAVIGLVFDFFLHSPLKRSKYLKVAYFRLLVTSDVIPVGLSLQEKKLFQHTTAQTIRRPADIHATFLPPVGSIIIIVMCIYNMYNMYNVYNALKYQFSGFSLQRQQ